MGGLTRDEVKYLEDKVPVLGDLLIGVFPPQRVKPVKSVTR